MHDDKYDVGLPGIIVDDGIYRELSLSVNSFNSLYIGAPFTVLVVSDLPL